MSAPQALPSAPRQPRGKGGGGGRWTAGCSHVFVAGRATRIGLSRRVQARRLRLDNPPNTSALASSAWTPSLRDVSLGSLLPPRRRDPFPLASEAEISTDQDVHLFLSWSGSNSSRVANALYEWLPMVLQAVKPFLSDESIPKGSQWLAKLQAELNASGFAIICVTPDNVDEPWLIFEAGAIWKAYETTAVAPLLVGLTNANLQGPLASFQATSTKKEDFLELLKSINKRTGARQLSDARLSAIFEKFWPDLETDLAKVESELLTTPATAHTKTRSRPRHGRGAHRKVSSARATARRRIADGRHAPDDSGVRLGLGLTLPSARGRS